MADTQRAAIWQYRGNITISVFISYHLGVQVLGIHVRGGVRVQVLGVHVRGGHPNFCIISCHLRVQILGIYVLGGVRVQVLGVQVRGGVSVSDGRCPSDAPDRPPPTQ
jgi:hypothetical protein